MAKNLPSELQSHRLLTDVEAAALLGCSAQKLRNDRCQRRGLRYVKHRRQVRYRLADILAHIDSHTIHPEGL